MPVICLPARVSVCCRPGVAVVSQQSGWLLYSWNVGLTQGPPDQVVDLMVACHPTESQATREPMSASSISCLPTRTVMRCAKIYRGTYCTSGHFSGHNMSALKRCCVLKFLHALEIDQGFLAHTPTGTGSPQKNNCKNLNFGLKFSV